MEKENRELLEEVINNRLERALTADNDETNKKVFTEAMEAVDRRIELSKLDASWEEQIEKRKSDENERIRDNELKAKESKRIMITRIVEVTATVVLAPIIEFGCKKAFAKVICLFETDNTFVTMAGKSLSGLFRFRK